MSAAPLQQNRLLGIGLRIAAVACFGIMAAALKLASDAGVNVPELVFYRSLFGLPPLMIWIAWNRDFGAWRTSRPLAHLVRAAMGLIAMALNFTALALLPLAEAVTISFVAPLFSVMLSALILAEPVGRHRWSAVAVGFLGVLIVMQPGGTHLPATGLAIALAAAMAVAAVTITLRQIGRTEKAPTIVLWFTCWSVIAAGLFMPAFAQHHDGAVWAILVAMGLFGGLGQLFMTSALRFAPVSAVVPFDYTQLLWAVLFGWLLWGSQPHATTWIGAGVIIVSGLYTLYRERVLGRERPPAEPL
jgi:drug/metabolite transporter (DMT)-like permease